MKSGKYGTRSTYDIFDRQSYCPSSMHATSELAKAGGVMECSLNRVLIGVRHVRANQVEESGFPFCFFVVVVLNRASFHSYTVDRKKSERTSEGEERRRMIERFTESIGKYSEKCTESFVV
jgi:hypothetical protein